MKSFTILHAADVWLGRDRWRDATQAAERFAAFERLVDAALEARPLALVFAGGLIDPAGLEPTELERLSLALERLRRESVPFVFTPARWESRPHAATQLALLAARGLATVLAPHPEGRLDPATPDSAGAYLNLGPQLRFVGLGAPAAAACADLVARAEVVAASSPGCVLVLAGAEPALEGELESFAYVALGGAGETLTLGPRWLDPGPLVAAAAGATPGFLQVSVKSSGVSARRCPSGAPALELLSLDVSGMGSLDELSARLRRKPARAAGERRILLRLTGAPALDLDAVPRAELARAAGKALAGASVEVDLATDLKLASHAVAVGGPRAELEAAALAALAASGEGEAGPWRDLALSCLAPLLDGRPEAMARVMASIVAFEERPRAD